MMRRVRFWSSAAWKIVAATALVLVGLPGQALAANPAQADNTWQVGGFKNAVVRSIVFSPTTIYIGGNFTTVRPPGVAPGDTSADVPRNHVAAFDRATGNLLPWNPDANGEVFSLALANGSVYLGGRFTSVGGLPDKGVAKVDASSGAVDGNFHVNAGAAVYVVKAGPNGNLFLGGAFKKINGKNRGLLAEITPAGQLLNTWRPTVAQYYGDTTLCPPRCHPVVFTIDFSTDGSTVYFGGHFGLVNGVQRNEAASVALNDPNHCETAGCVTAWNPSVFAPRNCPTCKQVETSRVYTLHITQTRAYACGGFWRINYSADQKSAVTRYNVAVFNLTDGTVLPRTAFSAEDDGDTPGCDLSNGVLYIGGHFNYVGPQCKCTSSNSAVRHHVAAVDATTGALLDWHPNANSFHGVYTIAADPTSGTVGFGGYFTKVAGRYHQGVAIYSGNLAR